MSKFQRGGPPKKAEEPYRINELIRVAEVRLVGDNVEIGVYAIDKALAIAKAQNLDLVEIAPNAVPPVCKVVDYSKFKYDQKKKQKELKAKAQKTILKEIRFGPNTDDHDFEFKLKHAIKFLQEGAKIKAYVNFVGRTIVFKERGEALLLKFIAALDDYGKVEQMPKLEGKRMLVFIVPKVAPTKKVEKSNKNSQEE
ncbi:MAG TPA: translation initiation factor IF-3 [Microscillaceae bacterium]|nr:translation initiation factor IF-3 [Microscillaceae bacterium]